MPAEEPEPHEPTPEEREGLANAADPAKLNEAIQNNPNITPERINQIRDEVENGTYPVSGETYTPEDKAIGDAFVQFRDGNIKASAAAGEFETPDGAPPNDPMAFSVEGDNTTAGAAGARNATKVRAYFREFIKGATLGIIDIGDGVPKQDGTPPDKPPVEDTPENRSIIDKAIKKVQDAFDIETSPGKKQLLKALLALLPNVFTGLGLLFTLKKTKDFLEEIAKGMDECDEVNFSKHTQIKLECGDGSSDALKAACLCPGAPGAPTGLSNLCSTFEPTHTCPDYRYIYFEYHWWNVLPAIVAGVQQGPQNFLDFITKNKWKFIIGGILILAFILAFGLIKHYAFGSNK